MAAEEAGRLGGLSGGVGGGGIKEKRGLRVEGLHKSQSQFNGQEAQEVRVG